MLANVFTKTARDRWKGMAIGVAVLAALLLMGMATYRDINLDLYTSLPEAYRSLINIPEGADVAALAYSAIYGSYGALIIASLAIAMGSSSIAGEERNGTIGLLLANPKSRTNVLASKAAAMVALLGLGSLALWAAAMVVPMILDVEIGGMHPGALVFHLFMISVFFGFLAQAIGATTGRSGTASGISAGVMIVSFFAVGLLPLVEGLKNLARAFPWYYFSAGNPGNNGINWGHAAVLAVGCVILGSVAMVGLRRRDLRSRSVGVSPIDRLRTNTLTMRVADLLAGSARVSRIWVKTISEHQAIIYVTATLMFLMMGVMIGAMYTLLDESLLDLTGQLPDTMLALFGGGDMSTPEGFYQLETFGMMAPIAVMVPAIVIGARSLAGEEAHRTMGLLLANPVSRTTVLLEKTIAMVTASIVIGVSVFGGVVAGSLVGGLGMSVANVAATSLLVTLVGLVFGAVGLALSAGTGRVAIATFGAVGFATVFYLLNAFLPLSDRLAGYAKWSPFHYYLSSDPLNNGMNWAHGALLTGLTAILITLSVWLFRRRDLRQTS